MTLRAVAGSEDNLRLDWKALTAIADALEHQLAAWRARRPEDMDEDDFADLQNDIGYLETLLGSILEQRATRYPR